jgi:serine/threonine-protein phosphatase 6 regulatory ankyrin repeat subunit B
MSGDPHPFFAAVREGNLDQIKKFLAADPSLLHATNYWRQPLDRVMLESNRPDVVEFFMSQGVKVNGLIALRLNKTNLLQQVLEEHPEEITNTADRLTLLDRAVSMGNIPMTKMLLKAGSDPNQWDNQGRTSLYYARTNANTHVEQILREAGARESVFDLLHLMDNNRLAQMANQSSLDLNRTNHIGFTPLHASVVLENETAVQWLLSQKVKTEIADYMGFTPLHYAAGYGLKSITAMLLEAGANPNARQARPRTGHAPLHLAAKYGHEDVIRLLIAKGASITATDDLGKTPKEWVEFQTAQGARPGLSFHSNYDRTFASDFVFALHLSVLYSRKPAPRSSPGLSPEMKLLLRSRQ